MTNSGLYHPKKLYFKRDWGVRLCDKKEPALQEQVLGVLRSKEEEIG